MIPGVAEALLIVDVQNDFMPGGALGIPDGDEILGRVNELARSGGFDLVVATRDWHPPAHGSFKEKGGPWPVHCVQGTPGAELHPGLDQAAVDVVLDKGQDPDTDGYTAFDAPELGELLRERGIDNLTLVGLATDYCVLNTGRDALAEGFGVRVDTKGVRGVDVNAGDSERALEELRAGGAQIT